MDTEIKKYCNLIGYTDVEPYEVVKVISPITVEIRLMDTKQIKFPQAFTPGGFVGHYADNHAQEYEYTSNPENGVLRVRLCKDGYWKYKSIKFRMADAPHKFYDYNF